MTITEITDVVYDSMRGLAVMTGTGTSFYPYYESDDPYAAYNRGYYFHGTSVM